MALDDAVAEAIDFTDGFFDHLPDYMDIVLDFFGPPECTMPELDFDKRGISYKLGGYSGLIVGTVTCVIPAHFYVAYRKLHSE